jgi:D-alanyl-D-alanine carboxypeptidase
MKKSPAPASRQWKEKCKTNDVFHFFRFGRIASVVAIAALMAFTASGLTSCGSPSFPAASIKKMEATVDKVMLQTGAPGAVVGVWTPEVSWTLARGKADTRSGRAMNTADGVAIGTNTNTFVGTVVLQLVEEKRLKLTDTLSKYQPQVPNSSVITVRQLLQHSSGIFDYTEDKGFKEVYADNPKKDWAPRDLVSIAIKHSPYFSPGKGWHYSNTDCILLGMIVEKVTNNALRNEINSRIVDKLDLKNTYLAMVTMVEGPENERAHGYETLEDNTKRWDTVDYNPSYLWAAGGMASDLDDMRVYAEALARGELLTPATQSERLKWEDTGATIGYLRAYYGLGITKLGNFLGHYGDSRGYSSASYYLPDKQATFFACITKFPNDKGSADLLLQDVAKVLYPDEFPK